MRTVPFRRLAANASALAALLLGSDLQAQPQWQWARRATGLGSFDNVNVTGAATDSQGNVYVVGKFGGVADFTDPKGYLTNFGDSDVFLAKYDSQGQFLWNRRYGGTGYDTGNGIAVDSYGYVYIAGRFAGPAAFGSTTLTNLSAGFIAKIDPATTNVMWAREGGAEWFGVAVDANSNSYAVGQVSGFQIAGSKIVGPVAVCKYNSSGTRQWFTNSMVPGFSAASGAGTAVAADSAGNVYMTGWFRRFVEFGSVGITNNTPPDNIYDEMFVAKFNTAGVPLWAKRGGGQGNDQGLGIGVDGTGQVFVTGYCDNTSALNSGISVPCDIAGTVFPASSAGGGLGSMFLAKYSTTGVGLWARKLTSTSAGYGLSVAANGEFLATGYFRPVPFDFGGVTLTKDWSNEELFVVGFDASGNAVWGRRTSSTAAGVRTAAAAARGADGSVYAVGSLSGVQTTEFDATSFPGFSSKTSMFVAKLGAHGPPRPGLQGISLLGGGAVRFVVSGTAGQSYVTEATGNLASWAPISTNVLSNGVIDVTDPGANGAKARFYRLRLP